MKRKLWWKIPLFIALAVFVVGGIVMLLWNALVPELFGGPVLNYWQAIGLLVLSKILLVGSGGRRPGHRRQWKHDRYWKQRFAERMSSMSPEERLKCRERWSQCGNPFREEEPTQGKREE